jgi:hypothetical protein
MPVLGRLWWGAERLACVTCNVRNDMQQKSQAKQIPNEKGRLVWVVYLPNGDVACHASVYRGDVGRPLVFRTETAAQQWAIERDLRVAPFSIT